MASETVELQQAQTKVRQTDFSAGKGNALQACVASLFGLDLDQVPNFIELPEGYALGIQNFVASFSYSVQKYSVSEASQEHDSKLCILRGKSPRGDHGHVVVARLVSKPISPDESSNVNFEMVHDPHPDDTFLDSKEPYGWFMVFDKAQVNTTNPHALNYSQDPTELFDIMEQPSASFDMYQDRPKPASRQKPRGQVHKDGDWHRSVHIWLVDPKRGQIGLQKRSPQKDTFPNRWDISAAGHVEAGVTDSRETAERELAEELGISISQHKQLQFAFTCPAEQADLGGCNCYEDVYILIRNSEDCATQIGQAEVTAFKWMPIHELESKLREKDNEYVPRVGPYIDAFFKYVHSL